MNDKVISEYIEKIVLTNGISKKTGNAYEYVNIVFKGGYSVPLFLNNDQMYIVKNVICKD